MAAVTIHCDFGGQENKVCHCFHFSTLHLPWSDGIGYRDISFLNVEFLPSFFTLLFQLIRGSLLSAIRVVLSSYMRLLTCQLKGSRNTEDTLRTHRKDQPPSVTCFLYLIVYNHLPSPPSPHPVSTTNLRSVSLDLPALVISFLSVWLRSLNSLFFWLCRVFIALHGLSLVVVSEGYSSLRCVDFSLQWFLLLQSTGSRCSGFSRCSIWAQKLQFSGPRAWAQ